MHALHHRKLASISIALAATFIQPGTAQTPDLEPYPERETLKLRSIQGHGDSQVWEVRKADQADEGAVISKPGLTTDAWQKAVVPGTLLNSLVSNDVYPEPYFGMNNKHNRQVRDHPEQVQRQEPLSGCRFQSIAVDRLHGLAAPAGRHYRQAGPPRLQRALAVAEAAGKMIQAGVVMSAYWPLSCKGDHERKSLLDSWTLKRTANYEALSLMANTIGASCIGSTNGDTGLYSFATQSADGRGITLYLINRSGRSHDALDVAFPGVRPGSFGAKLLSASDPKTNETTLVTIPCKPNAEGCVLKLPAWSMAVVRCSI